MHDNRARFFFLVAAVAITAVSRLLPHPPNFAPLCTIALFGGATFADRRLAFLIPLSAMLLSDAILGFHSLMPVVYAALAVNVALGMWAGNRLKVARLLPAGLAGTVAFFVISNAGVWWKYSEHTLASLIQCYTLAIPFFQNSLAADLVFGVLLFGAVSLAEGRWAVLRPSLSPSVVSG